MANEALNPTRTIEPDEGECKGCSASVHVTDEAIGRLVDEVAAKHPADVIPDDEYARRLEACRSCDSFQFGTTCRWCGCLVAVKAKKAEAKCPHPGGSRW